MIKAWNYKEIADAWNEGLSPLGIVQRLKLNISTRQVQRIGAKHGSNKLRHAGILQMSKEQVSARGSLS